MARQRAMPATKYPAGAIQGYRQAIRRQFNPWFAKLKQRLIDNVLRISDAEEDVLEELDERQAAAQLASEEIERSQTEWAALALLLLGAALLAYRQVDQRSQITVSLMIEIAISNGHAVWPGVVSARALQNQYLQFQRLNRLYLLDIGDQVCRNLLAVIPQAVAQGQSRAQIIALIELEFERAQRRILLIVMNQCTALNAELSRLRLMASGSTGFIWQHTTAKHPRTYHLGLVGQYFTWSYSPLPGQLPRCQCGMEPVWRPT